MKILTLCGLSLVWLVACSNPQPTVNYSYSLNQSYYCAPSEQVKQDTLQLLNQARSVGRYCGSSYYNAAPPLVWNEKLKVAAKTHSNDMAGHDFFSHQGSDGSDVGERVKRTGYRFRNTAENIQAGADTTAHAMRDLLNSPSHCKNIMNPIYQEVAAACSRRSETKYVTYYSQVFGVHL